jgi:hypothetical protein
MQTQTLEEEILDESLDQDINTQISSINSSWITSDTRLKSSFSYIQAFQDHFRISDEITNELLKNQKKNFGFTLFILREKSPREALKIGWQKSLYILGWDTQKIQAENRRHYVKSTTYERAKPPSIRLEPLNFFVILIGSIFISMNFSYVLMLLFFTIVQAFTYSLNLKYLFNKIQLYKKSRLHFNISKQEAFEINQNFYSSSEYVNFSNKNIKKQEMWFFEALHFNRGYITIFYLLYIFAMIVFIIAWYDGYLSNFILVQIITLVTVVSAYFRLLDKTIIFLLSIYFKIYFAIIDTYPLLFSPEDQERDFYLDIHKSGNTLISDIAILEELIAQFKNGTIDPKMGTYLTKVLNQATKLHALVEDRWHYLDWKETFQDFLRNLFNEILEKYVESYSYLEKRIAAIEQWMDFQNLNEEERNILKNSISPILQKNKEQLTYLKKVLLEKKLVVR